MARRERINGEAVHTQHTVRLGGPRRQGCTEAYLAAFIFPLAFIALPHARKKGTVHYALNTFFAELSPLPPPRMGTYSSAGAGLARGPPGTHARQPAASPPPPPVSPGRILTCRGGYPHDRRVWEEGGGGRRRFPSGRGPRLGPLEPRLSLFAGRHLHDFNLLAHALNLQALALKLISTPTQNTQHRKGGQSMGGARRGKKGGGHKC